MDAFSNEEGNTTIVRMSGLSITVNFTILGAHQLPSTKTWTWRFKSASQVGLLDASDVNLFILLLQDEQIDVA